jgi:hypothetical protein
MVPDASLPPGVVVRELEAGAAGGDGAAAGGGAAAGALHEVRFNGTVF